MQDIWITDDAVRTATDLDGLLDSLLHLDDLALHFKGSFLTKGCYRWGQFASRNLGKGWTIDGDAEIALDPTAITDIDTQPLYCLAGPANRVSGISTRGKHSLLAGGWPGSLRTGGVLLENGSIDGVTFRDFGAIKAETFVAEIVGSGSITNNLYTDHNPAFSDDQVSVFRTIGSENGEAVSPTLSIHEGNTVNTPGSKLVQAHTIYQSPGLVRRNKSIGADVFYYGDYYRSKDVTIEENVGENCIHGVQLKLSPTPLPQADTFSHEDYMIGLNRFESSGAQVSIDTVGPPTATRYIRRIHIHASLSVENFGGEISRFGGEELNARKGCNPFRR